MWKRILLDVVVISMVFWAPWWVVLIMTFVGVIMFNWYIEIIIAGMLYDVFFGGITGPWYSHLIHTFWFTLPLLIAEFIKPRINTR